MKLRQAALCLGLLMPYTNLHSAAKSFTPLLKKAKTKEAVMKEVEELDVVIYLNPYLTKFDYNQFKKEMPEMVIDEKVHKIYKAYHNKNPYDELRRLIATATVENWEKGYIDTINQLLQRAKPCPIQ